jgi:hypothetical protein
VISQGYHIEAAAAGEDADEGIQQRKIRNKQGKDEEYRNSRQGDDIGNDPVVNVDKGDGDERHGQKEIDESAARQTEMVANRNGHDACQQFHKRVADTEGCAAVAASPPQQNETQNRDVVVKGNGRFASRTSGPRFDDGFLSGQPINAHIQKTSDAKSHHKKPDFKKIECHRVQIIKLSLKINIDIVKSE